MVTGIGVGSANLPFRLQAALASASEKPATKAELSATPSGLPDFAMLANKIGPAVVNVSTTRIGRKGRMSDDPKSRSRQRYLRRGTPRDPHKQVGVESGFPVGRDGTIVTNYHVIDGAE